jgi:sensor c-di-GMP phosphodiesterase-like protein
MRHSLRRRLNRTFIGLSLVPLFLVGLILTWLAYVVERQQTQVQQTLIAQRVIQEVWALMSEMEDELRLTAQFGLTELSPERQEAVLLNLLSYHDHFEELALLNERGGSANTAGPVSLDNARAGRKLRGRGRVSSTVYHRTNLLQPRHLCSHHQGTPYDYLYSHP